MRGQAISWIYTVLSAPPDKICLNPFHLAVNSLSSAVLIVKNAKLDRTSQIFTVWSYEDLFLIIENILK